MKKGSKMTKESRDKCRAGQLRREPKSQATRDKISASHMGLGHTEETKEKLSIAAIKQYRLRPYESAYNTLKCNAKRRSLEATFSFEEYLQIIGKGECFYCGAILHWPEHNVRKSQASNLDRKDSTKGYVSGNVVACCWPCNNIKSNHFTFEQVCEIGKLLRSWNFPGSVKELPSYLNCVYCPSQSYLQKQFVDGVLAKYRCPLKHEFYIPKETHEHT
jgi:5-methylcytosine-specific restriction endonuclease McrA